MKRLAFAFAGLSLLAGAAEARAPCPAAPQPLPPALDSVGAPAGAAETIGFSAEPWEHPGRAWVVRLARLDRRRARVQIFRLARRPDCNVYDLERHWEAPIPAEDYRSTAAAVAAWARLPAGEIVTDGTGLELRVRGRSGTIRRRLNHYGAGGAELSALFRRFVDRYVPAPERPAEDWRTRRPATSPAPGT